MAEPGKHKSTPELLAREAEAEREKQRLVDESRENLADRCPECGAIGSLEERDGELKCIDCDETVLAKERLGGFGRR